jgi:hypothetical protein
MDISRFQDQNGSLIDAFQNNENPQDEDFVVSKNQRYLTAINRTNLTDTLFTGDSSAWYISWIQSVEDADLINLNGRLIQRDNSRQMADAIIHSMENIETRPKWSTNSRASAELNFSHQKQGSEYIQILNCILEENSFNEPTKRLPQRKIITNSAKRIPALNSFSSKDYREEALNWFEKHSSDEG